MKTSPKIAFVLWSCSGTIDKIDSKGWEDNRKTTLRSAIIEGKQQYMPIQLRVLEIIFIIQGVQKRHVQTNFKRQTSRVIIPQLILRTKLLWTRVRKRIVTGIHSSLMSILTNNVS